MDAMIDLGDELLIDISSIADPYLRLAAISFGQPLVKGSQWVAVNKQLAAIGGLLSGSDPADSLSFHPMFRKGIHGNHLKSTSEVVV
jgi:hypothetical protein